MRGSRAVLLGSCLCVALVAAVMVPVWLHARSAARTRAWDRREHAAARAPATGEDDVEAFAGDVEIQKGLRLTLRLAPLHATAGQQRFDAGALAARFGLAAGEPFVLEISARGEGTIAAGALRKIAIEDEHGPALAPFPAAAALDNEPADPLATLLAPPAGKLRSGTAVSVILWGRAPAADARVKGLGDVEVALAPTRMGSRELDTALARIDAQNPAQQNPSASGAPK